MPTPTGQIVVGGTSTPQSPATFQITAAGQPTQTQVGLVPSMSPYAFYQQTPVNALAQGGIAGNVLTFGGLTLTPSQSGWVLVSGQGGPGFVGGTWESSTGGQAGVAPAQGAFYRSGSGRGGSGGDDSEELPELLNERSATQNRLTKTGWILLGLIATLLLTDKGR